MQAEKRRSALVDNLIVLYARRGVSDEDLEGFSESLMEKKSGCRNNSTEPAHFLDAGPKVSGLHAGGRAPFADRSEGAWISGRRSCTF